MAQEASGIGSQASNPTNIGAVYFDKEQSPLQTHLWNLDQIDEAANQRRVRQKEKLALTGKLLGDIDPDVTGALESDIPELQKQTRELHEFMQQGLMNGFDPSNTSPQNQAFLQKIQNMSKQTELNAIGSSAAKAMVTQVGAALAADVNGDRYDAAATNKKLAAFRLAGMKGRQKDMTIDDILVRSNEGFGKTADDTFKAAGDSIYKITETPERGLDGSIQTRKVKTLDDNKALQKADVSLVDPTLARQAGEAYRDLSANDKKLYDDLAATLNKAYPSKNITPEKAMLYRRFQEMADNQQTIEDNKFPPHVSENARAGADERVRKQKGVALYDIMNGIMENNADMFLNVQKSPEGAWSRNVDGKPVSVTTITSTKLAGWVYGTAPQPVLDKDGKPVLDSNNKQVTEIGRDRIVSIDKDLSKPDKLIVKTVAYPNGKEVDFTEFPEVLYSSNYGNEGLDLLAYAAGEVSKKKKKGDVTAQGIASPTQTFQGGKTIVAKQNTTLKIDAKAMTYEGKAINTQGYNKTTNKTQFILSDGTKIIVDGDQRIK